VPADVRDGEPGGVVQVRRDLLGGAEQRRGFVDRFFGDVAVNTTTAERDLI
jgi:ribosomal protein S28E/S33